MFVIANVHDDKKIKKEYDFLDKNKDFVAVNMNKGIKQEITMILLSPEITPW